MGRFSGNDDEFVVDQEPVTEEEVHEEEKKVNPVEPTPGMTQDEMLNSLQKKVYVFDESGSMNGLLAREDGKDERESKTQAVKRMMKRFVTERFKKYPNSQISVLGFGLSTRVLCKAGAKWNEVQEAIDKLDANDGTDILQAVEFAVQHIEEEPSKLKTNQIIFVSDGMDYNARKVGQFVGKMKRLNITFDFIFVNSAEYDVYGGAVSELRKVCQETGGEYIEVTKATEFEDKFLEVSNRLALPPARG